MTQSRSSLSSSGKTRWLLRTIKQKHRQMPPKRTGGLINLVRKVSRPLSPKSFLLCSSPRLLVANTVQQPTVGQGFIAVDDPSQYTLPQPIDFQDQTVYSISVFHQLHCLVSHVSPFILPLSSRATPKQKHTYVLTQYPPHLSVHYNASLQLPFRSQP